MILLTILVLATRAPKKPEPPVTRMRRNSVGGSCASLRGYLFIAYCVAYCVFIHNRKICLRCVCCLRSPWGDFLFKWIPLTIHVCVLFLGILYFQTISLEEEVPSGGSPAGNIYRKVALWAWAAFWLSQLTCSHWMTWICPRLSGLPSLCNYLYI